MSKRMLILRACGMAAEKHECDNIKSQAELYGMEVHDRCPKTNQDVIDILNAHSNYYHYIYLSSHGNDEGFGSEDNTIDLKWIQLASELCSANCMKNDCIILLSCCRGGLHQVAYSLFYTCSKISYVVGPRQSLNTADMLVSFNILLYNLEIRNIDPIVACEKVKNGTDIRFICFDRLETESDYGYQQYQDKWSDFLKGLP